MLGRDIRIGFDNSACDSGSDIALLRAAGCERIYSKENDVASLSELVPYLRPGDVVVVANLAQVANNVSRLISELEKVHLAGAKLEVAKTDIKPGTPVGDAFVHVCAVLAQQCGGWPALAPKETKSHSRGRPPALTSEKERRADRLLKTGRMTVAEVARVLDVSAATIYRHFPRSGRRPGKVQASSAPTRESSYLFASRQNPSDNT